MIVAPATADMLAKAAHGLADDLLTNTLLTARCPVVFAPAMHTEMWEHPATQENVATLRRRGAVVIEPAVGRLTGVDTGKGRLPDPAEIFEVCRRVLAAGAPSPTWPAAMWSSAPAAPRAPRPGPLPRQPLLRQAGLRAGPHGRRARGAQVTLIAANTGLPDPAGVDVVQVGTGRPAARGGPQGGRGRRRGGDGRRGGRLPPGGVRAGKIKKKDGEDPDPIVLVANPDILAEISADAPAPARWSSASPPRRTTSWPTAVRSCERKGCDLLVVNEVGERKTFGSRRTRPWSWAPTAARPRSRTAQGSPGRNVWDLVARRLD